MDFSNRPLKLSTGACSDVAICVKVERRKSGTNICSSLLNTRENTRKLYRQDDILKKKG